MVIAINGIAAEATTMSSILMRTFAFYDVLTPLLQELCTVPIIPIRTQKDTIRPTAILGLANGNVTCMIFVGTVESLPVLSFFIIKLVSAAIVLFLGPGVERSWPFRSQRSYSLLAGVASDLNRMPVDRIY